MKTLIRDKEHRAMLRKAYESNEDLFQMLLVGICVFIVMSLLLGSKYYALSNLTTILSQLPQYGILTMCVAISMLLGGFDLSAVSLANLAAVVSTKTMLAMITDDMTTPQVVGVIAFSLFAAMLVGIAGGILNGFTIAQFRVPAMLATLGTGQIFKGIAIVLTRGASISGLPSTFSKIGASRVFNFIPVSFLIFLACTLALIWVFNKSGFGKQVRLIGTNRVAAYYSGIKVKFFTVKTFALCGLISAIGGIVMLAKNNSAKADYGDAYTLMCVMIAILGGVSPDGGYGKIEAVAVAIVIVQMISSAITMIPSLNNHFTKLIWGGILIAVILIRKLRKKNDR